jgi:hypothetical protein
MACADQSIECDGAVIEVQMESIEFGDLLLGEPPGIDGDLRVPERRVFFVKNGCGDPLVIESVCIVGNTHNQDPETPAFYVELEPGESLPLSVRTGKESGIRITYEVDSVNGDTDGDGVADQDTAVLVVHSNASNQPVLLAPICGRVVPNGEPMAQSCPLPSGFEPPEKGAGDCIR